MTQVTVDHKQRRKLINSFMYKLVTINKSLKLWNTIFDDYG